MNDKEELEVIEKDEVTEYAKSVVAKDRLAGPHVRAQCARHLRDLENRATSGLVWNLKECNKAIRFFENVLNLNGGSYEGQPFILLPWQKFVVGSLFGWHGADGFRRFRSAYIETAKGPLALDTPIATPTGFTTMGDLKVGDQVFDENGNPCFVTAVSPIFYDRECYRLRFSDGCEIDADAYHEWETYSFSNGHGVINTSKIAKTLDFGKVKNHRIVVCKNVLNLMRSSEYKPAAKEYLVSLYGKDLESMSRTIISCDRIPTVPVRCITVSSSSHLFLAGEGMIPTHNSGKSPLAAGVGIKGLVADDEPRAEIYSAATKLDQARILFRDAIAMTDQSPELFRRLKKSGVGERCWNLAYLAQASFFRPISSDDAQSGPRPHMALIDEVHEHKNNNVIEMMRAGTKSRRQALIFMITNSGSNKNSPCWGYHEYGAKVARGELIDDSMFPYICGLDDGDDPFVDESCWPKANPSLEDADLPGVKYIREQVTEAKGMPSKEAIIRRLNFCQWTGAESPWLSQEVWESAHLSYTIDDLKGRRAYAGLDLSSTTDLTALVFLVEPIAADEPWKIIPFCWLPEIGLQKKSEKDRVPYAQWKKDGYLDTTPGRAISKKVIIQKLASLSDHFDIISVAFDRWRIADLIQLAADEELTLPNMIPFGQGYKDMSPALEKLETMLLNGELAHNGHKVLTMCAGNAVTDQDPTGSRKLNKEIATGRIDLMVAAIMAAGLLGKEEPEETKEYKVFFA